MRCRDLVFYFKPRSIFSLQYVPISERSLELMENFKAFGYETQPVLHKVKVLLTFATWRWCLRQSSRREEKGPATC